MSSKELVDDGSETGVVEHAHFDVDGNLTSLQRTANVERLFESNKRAFNAGLQNRQSEFRKVGSYDPLTIDIFCKRWGVEPRTLFKNRELVKRLINDPDLRYFRTLPGRY